MGKVVMTVIFVKDYCAFLFIIPKQRLVQMNFRGNGFHCSNVDIDIMSRCNCFCDNGVYLFIDVSY